MKSSNAVLDISLDSHVWFSSIHFNPNQLGSVFMSIRISLAEKQQDAPHQEELLSVAVMLLSIGPKHRPQFASPLEKPSCVALVMGLLRRLDFSPSLAVWA